MIPEFHRPLAPDRIGPAGLYRTVAATPEECAALACRFDLPALHALNGWFRLHRQPRGVIAAEASLEARLVRTCVVSLEEFETTVTDTFALRFVPEAGQSGVIDPEGIDEIPYADTIDLGEALAEQLALILDPYPVRPNAELPAVETDAQADLRVAFLAGLRPRH